MFRNAFFCRVLFLSIILFMVLSLAYIFVQGRNQDKVWLADFYTYVSAKIMYADDEHQQASILYQSLLMKADYEDSITINMNMASISTYSMN